MSEPIHTLMIAGWTPTPLNRLMSHVRARIKRKQDDRVIVLAAALNADVPKAYFPRRVSVTVTAPGRLPDPDNLLKSLLDALVHAKLLVDDSAAWCELAAVKVERGPVRKTVMQLEDLVEGATIEA